MKLKFISGSRQDVGNMAANCIFTNYVIMRADNIHYPSHMEKNPGFSEFGVNVDCS